MQHSRAENSWRNFDQFYFVKDFFAHTLLLVAEQLNKEIKMFFFYVTVQDISIHHVIVYSLYKR